MAALGQCVLVCDCVCVCVGGCLIVLRVINCCDSRNVCVTSAPRLESISCLFWVSLAGYHSQTHTHTRTYIHTQINAYTYSHTHIYSAETRQLSTTLGACVLATCVSGHRSCALGLLCMCAYVFVCVFLQYSCEKEEHVWMVGLNNTYAWYFIHKGYTAIIMLTSSSSGILREHDVRNYSYHNLCYKPNIEKYYTFVMCHNGFSICCGSKGLNSFFFFFFFKSTHHTFCIFPPFNKQELCFDWSDNCTTV